jgi:hypothetical protein
LRRKKRSPGIAIKSKTTTETTKMTIKLAVRELKPPQLQFGGAVTTSDPKIGLDLAGPFDLRFGAARQTQVKVGIIGPRQLVDQTRRWLERCRSPVPVLGTPSLLQKPFPGFEKTFHMSLVDSDGWTVHLDSEHRDPLEEALDDGDLFRSFQKVVDLYSDAHARLAKRDTNRPDVVIVCIPDNVLKKVRSVERDLTAEEKKKAKAIAKSREARQMDMFDMLQEVEQTEEDFLKRDLRHALKARAMANKLPIQIVTERLLVDGAHNEDPATRAWNFTVGLYYKAGNVPWRLPTDGPETCFVGISFHHFRTTQRHIVQSTLAQAFSSEGRALPSAVRVCRRKPIRDEIFICQKIKLSISVKTFSLNMKNEPGAPPSVWSCTKRPSSTKPSRKGSRRL